LAPSPLPQDETPEREALQIALPKLLSCIVSKTHRDLFPPTFSGVIPKEKGKNSLPAPYSLLRTLLKAMVQALSIFISTIPPPRLLTDLPLFSPRGFFSQQPIEHFFSDPVRNRAFVFLSLSANSSVALLLPPLVRKAADQGITSFSRQNWPKTRVTFLPPFR